MTTTTTTMLTAVAANGTTPLAFTFQALSAAEIGIQRNGVETLTGFTVALNPDGTGTVTPTASWSTDAVIIYSKPNYQQTSNFDRFGPRYFDQMNGPLDRLARSIIALKGEVDRTVRVPLGKNGLLASTSGVVGVGVDGNAVFYPLASLQGQDGQDGQDAVNPNFTFTGTTTLAPGSPATVTPSGTYPNINLALGIPAGASGGATFAGLSGAVADNAALTSAFNAKEGTIAAGTTAQYWRGDKTWQTLNKTTVGLGSVDNTADSAKAVLSATKLTTARQIAGVSFDGSANITFSTQGYGDASNTNVATTAFVDRLRDLNLLTATAARALVLADRGATVSNTTGGWSIPANGTIAFPVGTVIILYNDSDVAQSITITTDTLRLDGTTTTGTRTLAGRGLGFLHKVKTTEWVAGGKVMS